MISPARSEVRLEETYTPAPLAPPIVRGSMVPLPWTGFKRGLQLGLFGGAAPVAPAPQPREAWHAAASVRRRTLLGLTLLLTFGAAILLAQARPMHEFSILRAAEITLFSLLFGWVAAGFFTALMGFVAQLAGDAHSMRLDGMQSGAIDPEARTAIIMPICNEHVSAVFAGLRATAESVAAVESAEVFDFFVLSDSGDAAVRAAEEAAVFALREQLGGRMRVYYRWRRVRSRRKAGNVADFCRRWGRAYRYMVVLDADSVMTGSCISTLVRLMQAHPRAGIIQTGPKTCGLMTIHARVQQFAGRVTGRLFTAGMQYWQLGDSHYWGHNAIIRTEAFMRHCSLAALPREDGTHSHILSHDFVEAALMGRAGYQTWLVSELEGSYEQQPANLIEELQRDRRWCEGNLQNARLIAEPGLSLAHRFMLISGAMAYLSAPLWLAYLLLGTAAALFRSDAMAPPGMPSALIGLWVCTAVLLFTPRILGMALIFLRREQRLYGGAFGLLWSALFETALSVLQAPVRMVAHSAFALTALTGLSLDWKSPSREAKSIGWRAAARRFSGGTLFFGLLFSFLALVRPDAALWMLPVALPLLAAVPLAVFSSHVQLGRLLRARGWLMVPEEASAPRVLRQAWTYARRSAIGLVAAPRPVAVVIADEEEVPAPTV